MATKPHVHAPSIAPAHPLLRCTGCGVEIPAVCDCNLPYDIVKPSVAAKKYAEAHPEKSNRAIAADIGVNDKTVRQVRKQSAPETKRTGRDGKQHPAQRQPAPSTGRVLDHQHLVQRINRFTSDYEDSVHEWLDRNPPELARRTLMPYIREASGDPYQLVRQFDGAPQRPALYHGLERFVENYARQFNDWENTNPTLDEATKKDFRGLLCACGMALLQLSRRDLLRRSK
jgi:hypothetical protein